MNNVSFNTGKDFTSKNLRAKESSNYFWIRSNRTETTVEEREDLLANTCAGFLKAGDFESCYQYAQEILPMLTQKSIVQEVLKNWALALKKLRLWDQLIQLQLRHIKKSDADYFTYLDIADSCNNAGDFESCIFYLELAVLANEANGADLERLSEMCLVSGQFAKAGKYFSQAAANAIVPNWNLWNNAAKSYLLAGNEHEAMFYLKVAVMIEPNNADTNYQIGLIYQHRNDAARASHYFQEAMNANPELFESETQTCTTLVG